MTPATVSPTPVSAASRAVDARRVAVASGIGTTIEWYDFFIYGTAAATVFGPQFFPQVSPLAGTLAAFGTFAIGFIARPLGGVVMGHYGDRLGRKFMLVWALMLMGLATFGIGLLPTYAQIGAWAPALLVALRFVQGFALGGEWGGAVLMSVEHAPEGRRAVFGSMVALGLPAGIVLSNIVFLLASVAVSPEAFTAWAWRVPFLASAALVAVGMWMRLGIAESPVFAGLRAGRATVRTPVVDVLSQYGRTVLLAAGSYVGISVTGYVVIVYFVSYATQVLGLPLPNVLSLLVGAAVLFAASIVVSARYADRLGRRRVVLWGLAGLTAWSLLFFPLADTGRLPLIALALGGMLVVQGLYIGPQPAVFAELFPAAVRYSGASLSLTLATILGGALAPATATALYGVTGDSSLITAYMVGTSILSWLCALGLEETSRRTL
jgi:MFS family permease